MNDKEEKYAASLWSVFLSNIVNDKSTEENTNEKILPTTARSIKNAAIASAKKRQRVETPGPSCEGKANESQIGQNNKTTKFDLRKYVLQKSLRRAANINTNQ